MHPKLSVCLGEPLKERHPCSQLCTHYLLTSSGRGSRKRSWSRQVSHHSPGTGTGCIPGEQAEPMQTPDLRRSLCKVSTGGIWSSSSAKQGEVQVLETLSLH